MHGGPSQVDTFDYKPALQRDHGKPFPGKQLPRIVSSATANLHGVAVRLQATRAKRPDGCRRFSQNVAGAMADELCFAQLRALQQLACTAHPQRLLELHTGSFGHVRAAVDGLVDYCTGSARKIKTCRATSRICPTHNVGGAHELRGQSAFLPAHYHGTQAWAVQRYHPHRVEAKIPFIENSRKSGKSRAQQQPRAGFVGQSMNARACSSAKNAAATMRWRRVIASRLSWPFRMQRRPCTANCMDISATKVRRRSKLYGLDNRQATRELRYANVFWPAASPRPACGLCEVTHSYKWDQPISKVNSENHQQQRRRGGSAASPGCCVT